MANDYRDYQAIQRKFLSQNNGNSDIRKFLIIHLDLVIKYDKVLIQFPSSFLKVLK